MKIWSKTFLLSTIILHSTVTLHAMEDENGITEALLPGRESISSEQELSLVLPFADEEQGERGARSDEEEFGAPSSDALPMGLQRRRKPVNWKRTQQLLAPFDPVLTQPVGQADELEMQRSAQLFTNLHSYVRKLQREKDILPIPAGQKHQPGYVSPYARQVFSPLKRLKRRATQGVNNQLVAWQGGLRQSRIASVLLPSKEDWEEIKGNMRADYENFRDVTSPFQRTAAICVLLPAQFYFQAGNTVSGLSGSTSLEVVVESAIGTLVIDEPPFHLLPPEWKIPAFLSMAFLAWNVDGFLEPILGLYPGFTTTFLLASVMATLQFGLTREHKRITRGIINEHLQIDDEPSQFTLDAEEQV